MTRSPTEKQRHSDHLKLQGMLQHIRRGIAANPDDREIYDACFPGWDEVEDLPWAQVKANDVNGISAN